MTHLRLGYLVLALTVAPGVPALAHEEGVLRLGANEIATGGELALRGEKLPKDATIRLELRGTLETFPLAKVRTNATGTFDARLALPLEARAGGYTVVALAPDGDVVARAELTVAAVAPPAASSEEMGEHDAHGAMNTAPGTTDAPHPTAEMMKVPISASVGEWAAIIGFVALSLGAGVVLLRGPAHAHRHIRTPATNRT
ncbi:MAG: hypothetical protein ACREOC_14505 [Gemmatimonadales bacterium]